jgi:hypothetical protein
VALIGLVWIAVSCGGNNGSSSSTGSQSSGPFTIGGTVAGLSGQGLVLQNNGGDSLAVNASGTFTFSTPLTAGTDYNVMVATQPSNPSQECSIANGSGTANANVTNIQVTCVSDSNEWAWMNGSNLTGQNGSYGTLGTASSSNVPPPRDSGAAWTDASGNFWLFGGTAGGGSYFSDLWRYSAGEWTWMSGSNLQNQAGSYGTLGVAATSNVPGSRVGAVTWIDSSGSLWLFGGRFVDPRQGFEYLNDLWTYKAGGWIWMGGSDQTNQVGIYGIQGQANSHSVPGGRAFPVSWVDAAGNFWLFGGLGLDAAGTTSQLNDLWMYSNGEWTWIGGSMFVGQTGVYGTQGVASSSNVPGARDSAVAWVDKKGNFWLFGGETSATQGRSDFNDLWQYSGGVWTWVAGSDQLNQPDVYGLQGTAAAANTPGARDSSMGWSDTSGNLWLFGGEDNSNNNYNDLWKYSSGQWTWVNGANVCCQDGIYGTEGTAAPTNTPGSRYGAFTWVDSAGNLWLFGGSGLSSAGAAGELNDLWEYHP